MHWEWRGMVVNFMHGQAINLENHVFACAARKDLEIGAHSIPHPCFSLPHAAGASWAFFPHVFYSYLHFSWLENLFLVLNSEWAEEIHDLGG